MRTKYKLRTPIILLLLLLLISSNIIITVPATAISTKCSELRWAEGQEVQEADVRPGESGIVTFAGTASVDLAAGGDVEEVWFELQGSTDMGWPVTVSPSTIKFDPSTEEKPFSAQVTVPQGTSYYTPGTITVNGTATSYPDQIVWNISGIQGTVRIKQFYRFIPSSPESTQFIEGEEGAVFDIVIDNTGNARDKFMISIENSEELLPLGFTFEYYGPIEINSNESDTIQLIVYARDDVDNGVYDIEISIKSIQEELNEGSTTPQTLSLSVVVGGKGSAGGSQDSFFFIGIIGIIVVVVIVAVLILILKGLRNNKEENQPPYNDPRMNQ